MGRHSAPDDDDVADDAAADPAAEGAIAVAADPALQELIASRGRHSRSDEPDVEQTQRIAIIDDAFDLAPPPEAPTESAPTEADEKVDEKAAEKAAEKASKKAAKADRKAAKKSRESDTRADLRILRQNSAVRAQAIGAVVVSFLVYTLVMIVLGQTGSYLMWLWIPIVASGILVGLVLDLAHRRATKKAAADQPAR